MLENDTLKCRFPVEVLITTAIFQPSQQQAHWYQHSHLFFFFFLIYSLLEKRSTSLAITPQHIAHLMVILSKSGRSAFCKEKRQ